MKNAIKLFRKCVLATLPNLWLNFLENRQFRSRHGNGELILWFLSAIVRVASSRILRVWPFSQISSEET